MNFIDDKETLYLPREKIQELLRHFDANAYVFDKLVDFALETNSTFHRPSIALIFVMWIFSIALESLLLA